MNIQGVRQLVGSKLNKIDSNQGIEQEGVNGEHISELTLDLTDDELLELSNKWENNYQGYDGAIQTRQKANKSYYLAKQVDYDCTISPNLLFEAEETFLPAALSKNPEPVVYSDNTEEGKKVSNSVKAMLQYHADTLVLRRHLAMGIRHWSTYLIGCLKHGWDTTVNDISIAVVNPRNLIFSDIEAYIDCWGDYTGEAIGERKSETAQNLCDMFPKHKEYITVLALGKMGTKLTYTEWWTDKYCFYKLKNKILDKNKNPHWNEKSSQKGYDENNLEIDINQPAKNHFSKSKKPYTFISVFGFQEQPHDETNLIEQNIPNQKRITKRTAQIDRNLDGSNNSIALSGLSFTQETATQAAQALQAGRPVLVPDGRVNEAIARFPAPGVPNSIFTALDIDKNDLRSIFGTQGMTAQNDNSHITARGDILNMNRDNSRIGGGIGDVLEQVADNVFNWWVQLYTVYYDEPHFAAILGKLRAVEYETLSSFKIDRKIVVSVSPGSMKPKDEITEMNQALDLAKSGWLDPLTLFEVLNFPDPQKTSKAVALWKVDPQMYMATMFPEIAQAQAQQAMMGGVQQGMPGQIPQEGNNNLGGVSVNSSLSQVPLNQ